MDSDGGEAKVCELEESLAEDRRLGGPETGRLGGGACTRCFGLTMGDSPGLGLSAWAGGAFVGGLGGPTICGRGGGTEGRDGSGLAGGWADARGRFGGVCLAHTSMGGIADDSRGGGACARERAGADLGTSLGVRSVCVGVVVVEWEGGRGGGLRFFF